MIYINLLIIQLIIVFVIDISGFIDEGIEPALAKILKQKKVKLKKPFSCSLCMTTWIGLIYILIYGSFTIPMIGYVFLLAYLTPIAYNFLLMVMEALTKITNLI